MSTPYIALFTMSTLFFLMLPPPPRSTLFPYTTLFRSFEQAKFIFQKVEKALVQAGSSLQEVVRVRTFITDISRWEEVARAQGDVFGDIRPAATLVQVSALISPDLLVEIEVDAIAS